MQAYPDNPAIGRLVDNELNEFGKRIERFKEHRPKNTEHDDTGMVNTAIYYPYNYPMALWLSRNYGKDIEIDWETYREKESDPLLGLLSLFALYSENDAIDDEERGTIHWIKTSADFVDKNTLRWLLNSIGHLNISEDTQQYLYDNAELLLKWNLGTSKAARTMAKLPEQSIYYQKSTIKKSRIDLAKSIKKPAPAMKLLPGKSADLIIETLTYALLPRHRELYPLTYANRNEIYEIAPGRGLKIYFLGMKSENRLPLEADYSALLIKNGVPIGYGISVVFFDRCEIALNIFDTFRSGEASYIFEQFVRVFYHHFGARNFIMRKYQVGHENDEGIKSGAYWFYYKMGFRSLDPQIDRLAHDEWLKIVSDKSYRSDAKTLKRLAHSDLHWTSSPKMNKSFQELAVTDIGYALTKSISSKFGGNREKALQWSVRHIKSAINMRLEDHLSNSEQLQIRRFAPLIALIPDLKNWSQKDKTTLIEIIKAKAATREIDYVKKLQGHKRLYKGLWDLVRINQKATV